MIGGVGASTSTLPDLRPHVSIRRNPSRDRRSKLAFSYGPPLHYCRGSEGRARGEVRLGRKAVDAVPSILRVTRQAAKPESDDRLWPRFSSFATSLNSLPAGGLSTLFRSRFRAGP